MHSLDGRRALAAIGFAIALAGCGEGNPYVPVTGTVKFADGSVPMGQIASITFQPVSAGANAKGASGDIAADGSFSLQSARPGDGALPGDYRVTVHIMNGYPNGKSVVADAFTKVGRTPLAATVESDGANHFDFVVDKR